MEKQLEHQPCGSITQEQSKSKRPYNKISQETRSQILRALTIQKLPLLTVAEMFQTKPCTCKAILLTYEQEGRTEKKTSRRERVEIDSKIKVIIVDPLTNTNFEYFTVKHSKMYTEEKDLNKKEESQLRRKLQQELLQQIEELQTACYLVQQTLPQENSNDEIAPENIVRGVNMSIHLVQSKIKSQGIQFGKQEQKKLKQAFKKRNSSQKLEELIKIEEGKSNPNQVSVQNQNQESFQVDICEQLGYNYSKIKQFIDSVNQKSNLNPMIIERLNYLTNETILQMSLKQRLSDNDYYIAWLKQNIAKQLKQFFQYF